MSEKMWDWILTDFDVEKVERIKLYRKIREVLSDEKQAKKLMEKLDKL